jgi:hypothetical protein
VQIAKNRSRNLQVATQAQPRGNWGCGRSNEDVPLYF